MSNKVPLIKAGLFFWGLLCIKTGEGVVYLEKDKRRINMEAIIAGAIGGIITIIPLIFIYRKQRDSLAKTIEKIHFDIFSHYNKMYDDINNDLNLIKDNKVKLEEPTEKEEYKNKIKDYINICSEEYYWKSKKLIEDEVWLNWENGINENFKNDFMKETLREEKESNVVSGDSYYGFMESDVVKEILKDKLN
jgi:hypothetical protein